MSDRQRVETTREDTRRIVVNLMGGVGNQLFQLAAARSLSEGLGIGDIRFINDAPRTGSPNLDSITGRQLPKAVLIDRVWVHRIWMPDRDRLRSRNRQAIIDSARALVQGISSLQFVSDSNLDIFEDRYSSVFLSGFFQSPDWFRGHHREVAEDILTASYGLRASLTALDSVVVSVRQTDYLRLGWALQHSYYREAMIEVGAQVGDPVIVVGDDGSAVESMSHFLMANGYRVLPPPKLGTISVMGDFWIMVAANRLVLSNSSFAWWAAAVGDIYHGPSAHPRLVIVPDPWLPGVNNSDPRLDNWTSVPGAFGSDQMV